MKIRVSRSPSPLVLHPWWAHLDSNQGPTGYEPVALPIELWALSGMNSSLINEGLLVPITGSCQYFICRLHKKTGCCVALHPSSLQRTSKYASLLRVRAPCLRPFYEAVPHARLLRLFTRPSYFPPGFRRRRRDGFRSFRVAPDSICLALSRLSSRDSRDSSAE